MRYYVHHVPGRLRIRIPQIKRQAHKARHVTTLLASRGGFDRVEANVSTGSVTVYYDPETTGHASILNLLKRHGYFDETQVLDPEDYYHHAGNRAGKVMGRALFSWAVGRVLEANGMSFLAAFI